MNKKYIVPDGGGGLPILIISTFLPILLKKPVLKKYIFLDRGGFPLKSCRLT